MVDISDTTDLNEPDAPSEIPDVLLRAAQKMREQAMELNAAWQDRQAGKPWLIISDELERCASRINARIR